MATALLDSGPWTLAALIVMAALILPHTHAPAWNVFFYGVLASLAFQGLFLVWFLRKLRRRKAAEASQ